jgi:hypothetical protein
VKTAWRAFWVNVLVVLEPMISRVFISTSAGSSPASVVTVSRSPGRPTARPTTTGVAGIRCRSTRSLTSPTCQVRVLEAGLYRARTRSAAAAFSTRSAMTGQGFSRSERLITQ